MAKKIEILENTLLKLLVRRGTNQDRKAITLSEGELGYTTDTNRLYVGDGSTEGGVLVGNKFLGQDNEITTFTEANIGDLAYDTNDRALYAYMGPGPASVIDNWQLISSVTDEGTGNILIGQNQIKTDLAGDGLVVTNGQLAIKCDGIKTNKVEPCTGIMQLPNTVQFGGGGVAYQYTIPSRQGSAGKFLVGDNNGNLSWSSDIGVGSITYFSTAEETIPVGAIVAFADLDAVQSNWLICNGDTYNKATYPDLFDVIGYDYGGSDPLFAVPNLLDKTLFGTEDKPTNVGDITIGSGGDGGASFGTKWQQVSRGYGEYNETSGVLTSIPTTYTNDTGYYLVVNALGGKNTQDYVRVDVVLGTVNSGLSISNQPGGVVNLFVSTNSGGGVACNGTVIIPPGEKYTFFQVAGSGMTTFEVFELRGPAGDSTSGISNAVIETFSVGPYTTEGSYTVNLPESWISGTPDYVSGIIRSENLSWVHNSWVQIVSFTDTQVTFFIQSSEIAQLPSDTYVDLIAIAAGGSASGISNASATVYAIKAVADPVVNSTMTVKSPLTASVNGVQQGENAFNSLEGDIEIGIAQSTISLDDIQMFNFRSAQGVSKGYIESADITANYRGSLPVSFDSGVKFVELKYTSSLANPGGGQGGGFAEDSTNGTIYIDWENKTLKQSSLRKEGDASHYQHWYESTGAESDGIIMFNTPDSTPANSAEGIIINWSTKTIQALPAYNRTYSNGSADPAGGLPPYEHQYVFRDLTNSGSFAGAGGAVDQKWEAVTDGTYDFDQAGNLETSELTNTTGSPLVIRGQFAQIDQETGDDDITVTCVITHAGETASVNIPFASEVGFNTVNQGGGGYAVDGGSITIPAGATYKFIRTTNTYDAVSWYKMTTTAVVGTGGGLKDPNHAGGTFNVTASFQDLDLSSIVGSNKAQVTMEVYGGSFGLSLFFRRKGSVTDPYMANNYAGWGASSVITGPPNDGGTIVIVTDSSGIVQYRSDNTSNGVNYKVLTYQVIS